VSDVSVSSGPAFANENTMISLSVPHGCEGEDTVRIEVMIPETLTGVRPQDVVFGLADIEADDLGNVIKIVWSKPEGEGRESDTHFYEVSFRARMPDQPFTKVHLPTTQYCLNALGEELAVSWTTISDSHDHNGVDKPAPAMMIYPARHPGWNQYSTTTGQHLHDMSIFDDAEILWWNKAAYSSNPAIMQMIEADSDTSTLTEIHDNATIWVKY